MGDPLLVGGLGPGAPRAPLNPALLPPKKPGTQDAIQSRGVTAWWTWWFRRELSRTGRSRRPITFVSLRRWPLASLSALLLIEYTISAKCSFVWAARPDQVVDVGRRCVHRQRRRRRYCSWFPTVYPLVYTQLIALATVFEASCIHVNFLRCNIRLCV